MKLLKISVLSTLAAAAMASGAFAQILQVDSWTGDTWSAANQPAPGFSIPAGGGTLRSDQVIAGSPNTGTSLTVSGLSPAGGPPSMFTTGALYTGSATGVSFSLTVDIQEGTRFIEFAAGDGGFTTLTNASLNISFTGNIVSQDFVHKTVGTSSFGPMTAGVWYLEIDPVSAPTSIVLDWTLTGAHTPIAVVSLTQSVDAIPEPSTYALIGAGVLLSGFMARRRRLAKK